MQYLVLYLFYYFLQYAVKQWDMMQKKWIKWKKMIYLGYYWEKKDQSEEINELMNDKIG